MKPRKFYLGEKRPIGIVLAAAPEEVNIATATYQVKDSTGAVLDEGAAQIESEVDGIMFLLDTTLTKEEGAPPEQVPVYRDGATYKAIFTATFQETATVFMEEVEFTIKAI